MEGSFCSVRCPEDGGGKGGENPGDHLCPHAETGVLPEVLSWPECSCAKSLPWCCWGRVIQADSLLRGTKCSDRAGKGSPRAVSRVCVGAQPGRDHQELQSTLKIPSKQLQESFRSCTVCLCFLSSPALLCSQPQRRCQCVSGNLCKPSLQS